MKMIFRRVKLNNRTYTDRWQTKIYSYTIVNCFAILQNEDRWLREEKYDDDFDKKSE